jgi:hypothetical protein
MCPHPREVRRLGDDVYVVLAVEQQPQISANGQVVVSEDNTNPTCVSDGPIDPRIWS